MVNPEKGILLEIRPRLFRTVWILLSEYSPNHSTKLAWVEEFLSVRSPETAYLSNSWESAMNNLIACSCRFEQPWMRGLPEPENSVLPVARLSWTCWETTGLRESLTLAIPSTVASKPLGVSSAPT